jgi:hypothetical protein
MSPRTIVQLDQELLDRVRELVPQRDLSRFINEVLAEKLDTLERQRIEETTREGYIVRREEAAIVAADWSAVDVEGWPD